MLLLVKILGLVFGDDLFVTDGWPMGQAGISNKLWDEMHKVGAKEFDSYFVNVKIDLTRKEAEDIIDYVYDNQWVSEEEEEYDPLYEQYEEEIIFNPDSEYIEYEDWLSLQ